MSTNIEDLSKKIEALVKEHIDASRKAAAIAVERAFNAAEPKRRRQPPKGAASGRRRTSDEVAELGERFLEVLCASPGETIAVLAAQIGVAPRDLQRSVALLKQAGRVRSVGQKRATRYFPTAKGARAA